ncbi:LysR family transcriptional regulator [Roseospira marina]|uniref:LysR family transcriptional regulator n=1 Tax=Roseospira marina TaxID=140057 RepID=A0A5M6IGW6_9PROT|nr:LysR family transcriptional regulator [Roseospira marina]KAA5606989.1 LysR family transcriptional regulator [Roseospira marina]MBB4312829.1 LysR family glycine cleavage system transcriptional activator [Roseospira marina]MBB5086398.1 LysR family glycine cleavage system transcriptional activator [Roseospira marina]
MTAPHATRRLPPLNAVRAFEAAGRLGGFTAAARDLGVSQGAVSRQIGILERWLGQRLFDRVTGGVRLTAAGASLLPAATEALDGLERAAGRLTRDPWDIDVAASVTLAMRWLMPRLPAFQSAHPHARLKIASVPHDDDVSGEVADVRLRFQRGDTPDADAHVLRMDRSGPLAAPGLISRGQPLRTLRPIIASRNAWDWTVWSARTGIAAPDLSHGLILDTDEAALQAGRAGLGVVLADLDFAAPECAAGHLTQIGPAATMGYYVIECGSGAERLGPRRFVAWLDTLVAPA